MKKSQVTIYAILILVLAGAFVISEHNKKQEVEANSEHTTQLSSDVLPVKNFVEDCIKNTAKEGLGQIGNKGGYYNLPFHSFIDEIYQIPIYLSFGLPTVPSLKDIESELNIHMNNNIDNCLNNFETFKNQGYAIEKKQADSSYSIGEDIIVTVDMPLSIKKQSETTNLDQFQIILSDIPMKRMYSSAVQIIDWQLEDLTSICVTCLFELEEEHNLQIDYLKHPENVIIFTITNFNLSNTEVYNYTFAVEHEEYSCDNLAAVEDPLLIAECFE